MLIFILMQLPEMLGAVRVNFETEFPQIAVWEVYTMGKASHGWLNSQITSKRYSNY